MGHHFPSHCLWWKACLCLMTLLEGDFLKGKISEITANSWEAGSRKGEQTPINVVDTFIECHHAMAYLIIPGGLKVSETQLSRILQPLRIILSQPVKLSKFKFRKQWEKTYSMVALWSETPHCQMLLEVSLHFYLFSKWIKELLPPGICGHTRAMPLIVAMPHAHWPSVIVGMCRQDLLLSKEEDLWTEQSFVHKTGLIYNFW